MNRCSQASSILRIVALFSVFLPYVFFFCCLMPLISSFQRLQYFVCTLNFALNIFVAAYYFFQCDAWFCKVSQLSATSLNWIRKPAPHKAWDNSARAWWRRDNALVCLCRGRRRTMRYQQGATPGGRGTPPSRWGRGPEQRPGGTRPSVPPWSRRVSALQQISKTRALLRY